MKNYQVPTRDELSTEGQDLYDGIHKAFGRVPNLYAYIAKAPNTLGAYLGFQQAMAKGAFSAKEREAVFLVTSQVNGCRYCLSVHTTILGMQQVDEAETLRIRQGNATDPKLRVITQLAAEIAANRGRASEAAVEAFYGLGYNEAALLDLVALVIDKTLANYVHNLTDIDIDWPLAQNVEANFELAA